MKTKVEVWTLSWDTDAGTDCRVFGSEAERDAFFGKVIESSIARVNEPNAEAIRAYLDAGDLGEAYRIWQESYKPSLDTYNWDKQEIDLSLDPVSA